MAPVPLIYACRSQAYYVNDTFWEGPASGAPVFLCVGGEGPPFDSSVVRSSVHCNNAVEWLQENKAIMFAVQHRYYGCHTSQQSGHLVDCPVQAWTNDTTKDLHFLVCSSVRLVSKKHCRHFNCLVEFFNANPIQSNSSVLVPHCVCIHYICK